MERNNRNEGTHEEEQCSLSDIIYSFCSENHSELNPLQEIFGVTKNNDHEKHDEEPDEESYRMAKRQRSMEYRMMMEKRRKEIKDKVDILQGLMPNHCTKPDLASKLENIIEYIKSLKYQVDVSIKLYLIMSMAYTTTPVYTPPFYAAAQAPCMSPWGYYTPGVPMMPQQNMTYIPQYPQVYGTVPPNQTQP
nr:putative bHLH109 transcription factor [Arabidopsis thaliana]